jgi:hypothetical protein
LRRRSVVGGRGILRLLMVPTLRRRLSSHLLVVGLMLGEDLLPEFLLALVDIRV